MIDFDSRRSISIVDNQLTEKSTASGRLKKKKGKEEVEKKKEEVPSRHPRLHAAHAPSTPAAGHPQDVTASQPAGDYRPRAGRRNVSLRWERDRGDKGEVFKREEGYLFRAGSFREQEPIGLQCQRRNPTPSRHGQPVRPAAGSQPSADSRWCGSRHLGAPPSRGRASEQKRTTRKNMSRHGKPHPANLPEPIQGQGTNT
ncbi:hypothetical protein GW17_00009602 [Ensete ventricosum]|nr:hypothetical protein GW17_00009602 [Ensete ventricosum]